MLIAPNKIIQPVMTLFGCSASIRMMHAEKSIANAVILLRLPDYIFFCYPLNYVHIVAYGDNYLKNLKNISGGNKNALLWIIPAISCGKYNYSARSG